jgi:hypothetical protein
MKLSRLFVLGLAMVGQGLGQSQAQADPVVEPTVVLRIGELKVSSYALDKNLARLLAKPSSSVAGRSGGSDSRFRLYLAQQVVIAKALEEGFAEREEVRHLVDRMERHMLSISEGPLYRLLYADEPMARAPLQESYARVVSVPEVLVVRMNSSAAPSLMGAGWDTAATAERLQRLDEAAFPRTAIVHRGPLPWPYGDFADLGEQIGAASAGSWIEQKSDGQITILYIRSVDKSGVNSFDPARAGFEGYMRNRRMDLVRQKRRVLSLRESGLVFQEENARRVVDQLQSLPARTFEIPGDRLRAIATLPLASYRRGELLVAVSVSGWRDYFNDLFVRRLPRQLEQLRTDVEDLVMMELDCLEARRRGLEQTARFVEDRRNFLYYQALDLFEKERLCPAISISDAEVETHYRDHLAEYDVPVRANGMLLRFMDAVAAAAWVEQNRGSPGESSFRFPGLVSATAAVVSGERPLEMFPNDPMPVLMAPDGQVFGPFVTPAGCFVFIKRSTKRETPPLGEVAGRVRAELMREKLHNMELSLAREWAGRFEVEDRIPYAKIGFGDEKGRGPWSSPTP